MSTWVQHKSGVGERYEVETKNDHFWEVSDNNQDHWFLRLPLKEYIECSPPEVWEDVTEECDWGNAGEGMEAIIFHQGLRLLADRGYRLRKIKDMYNISYFIVERRKS